MTINNSSWWWSPSWCHLKDSLTTNCWERELNKPQPFKLFRQTFISLLNMWMKWRRRVFVDERHLSYVPLEASVHVLRFDEVFAGCVQILLQLVHSAAEGNDALLHLQQLFTLSVHHLLQLRHFSHLLIRTQRAIGGPLETRNQSGLEIAPTSSLKQPFNSNISRSYLTDSGELRVSGWWWTCHARELVLHHGLGVKCPILFYLRKKWIQEWSSSALILAEQERRLFWNLMESYQRTNFFPHFFLTVLASAQSYAG